MKDKSNQQTKTLARVRTPFVTALVLACALGTQAMAQQVKPPATPTGITAPAGNSAFLLGRATGTQGYVCLPTSTGASTASWTVNNARPEATLFTTIFGQDFQIITHFLSPDTNPNEFAPNPLAFANATWQSSFDSSKVWAQTVHAIPAGSDASCPNAGSIACLSAAVDRKRQGSDGWHNPGQDHLRPTLKHQRRIRTR